MKYIPRLIFQTLWAVGFNILFYEKSWQFGHYFAYTVSIIFSGLAWSYIFENEEEE